MRAFTEYKMRSSDDLVSLDQVVSETYFGAILDPGLKFRDNISSRVNKANRMLGIIRSSLNHLNSNMFKYDPVRPHIEYAAAVWSPRYITGFKKLEGVQKLNEIIELPREAKKYSY